MAYTIKPSIGMLPIADLDKAMAAEGYIKKLSKSDIKDVTTETGDSGSITREGITDPTLIALCAGEKNADGSLDRETVKNAKELNGIAAKEYLIQKDKEDIGKNVTEINDISSDEIQLLKEELYHLKSELVRTGYLHDTRVADGYLDGFKRDNVKYSSIKSDIKDIQGDTIIPSLQIGEKEDWVVIRKNKNDEQSNFLANIKNVNGVGIDLDIGTADVSTDKSNIMTSLGEYNKGTFSFSRIANDTPGSKENITLLNDDSNVSTAALKSSNTGFATLFKMPNRCAGFLTSLTLNVKSYGNPGTLKAFMFKASKNYINEITKTNGLSIIESDGNMIAKSNTITANDIKDGQVEFSFKHYNFNPTNPTSKLYSEVEGRDYCFVVVADNLTQYDYYEFEFGQKLNSRDDLETNNTSYRFVDKDMVRSDSDVFTEMKDMDMLYIVKTKNKEEESEIPYNVGLYTPIDPIELATPIKAARATLTLEVNREGNFITSTTGLVRPEIDAIRFNVNGESPEQAVIGGGDKIIIGNEIATVKTSSVNTVTVDKGIYLKPATKIYRCGYKAKIKTSLVQKDQDGNPVIKAGSEKIREMKLVGIIPNGTKINNSISDRLVFEVDVNDLEEFNKAELQIKWRSTLSSDIIYAQSNKGNDYIGRIYNLSLAFSNKSK